MACKHHWSCPLIHWRNPQTSFMQPNQILILCGCSLVFPVNCTADVLQVHCSFHQMWRYFWFPAALHKYVRGRFSNKNNERLMVEMQI